MRGLTQCGRMLKKRAPWAAMAFSSGHFRASWICGLGCQTAKQEQMEFESQ